MEESSFDLPVSLHLEHNGDAKYIIVGITDAGSENPQEFSSYGFVSIDLHFHSDIFDEYQIKLRKANKALRATVLGGGIVTVNQSEKSVRTYGTSGGYGSTSLALLRYVVSKAFEGYTQDVTITKYIRG
jgi:hypothetical protein